uniref:Uncharacterized protein n=1 Tax=Onchocerca flexuosa TaxID=387005 RepID=A0A183HBD4_9BILA
MINILDFDEHFPDFSKNSVEFIEKVLRSWRTKTGKEGFLNHHLYKFIFTRSVLLVRLPSATAAIVIITNHRVIVTVTVTNNIDGPSGRGSMSSPIRKIGKRKGQSPAASATFRTSQIHNNNACIWRTYKNVLALVPLYPPYFNIEKFSKLFQFPRPS